MRSGSALPRFRLRTFLVIIAVAGICLGIWRDYSSPRAVWRRASRNAQREIRIWNWNNIYEGRIPGLTPAESLSEIIAGLEDENQEIRTHARQAYARTPLPTREAFARVASWFREKPSDEDRQWAAWAVRCVLERGEDGLDLVVPGLLDSLQSSGALSIRKSAVDSVVMIASRSPSRRILMLKPVCRMLEDSREDHRLAAALALARFEEDELARPTLEAYFVAHREGPPISRPVDDFSLAQRALASMADRSDEAAHFLLSQVYRQDLGFWYDEDNVKEYSFANDQSCPWLPNGQPGRSRVEFIARHALDGADPDLQLAAMVVLHEHAPGPEKELIPYWLAALHHEEWYVRRKAAGALGQLGWLDNSVVPPLQAALQDPDPEVRMMAANSLRDIEYQAAMKTSK